MRLAKNEKVIEIEDNEGINTIEEAFKFQELVDFFLRISSIKRGNTDAFDTYGKASVTERRIILINEFVTNWRNKYEGKIPFLTLLRMILADRDRSRSYHIKELTLSNMICSIYGINRSTDEYKRLFNGDLYAEVNGKYSKSHQLASMMAEIISSRQVGVIGGAFNLVQIDELLNQLDHNHEGSIKNRLKNAGNQKKILQEMFKNMNHDELKYIILIILKCRIIGHSETAILRAWHPDAPNYFSVVSNLEVVCARLKDPSTRLKKEELSVQVLHPFAPQLASQPKKSYADIVNDFGGNFIIEEKLDGERLQVHMEKIVPSGSENSQSESDELNFKFKFYSRKATDYTLIYGEDFYSGTLAPYFKEVIGERRLKAINKLVLDGEVLSFDLKRQVVLPMGTLKSTNVEIAFDTGKEQQFRPLFVIFDILILNDQLICDKPLFQRKSVLKQLINPKTSYIELILSADASTEEDIQTALQGAIESNSEGIIVKDKRKKYEIDNRHECWIKVKPEYMQEFGANMDLCVIGKEPSKKTSYICGLRVGEATNNEHNAFQSFCSIANGISISDYEKIESMTLGKWHNFENSPPPETLLQFSTRKPIEWIHPKDSVVLEIKARDIEYGMYGKRYKVGSTLLSGYMKSIRSDKDWKSSMSLEDFLSWKERTTDDHNSKSRKLKLHNIENKIRSRGRSLAGARGGQAKFEYMRPIDAKSDLFKNVLFYILSDYTPKGQKTKRYEIQNLKEVVKEYGGSITNSEKVKLEKNQVFVPISERKTIKVKLVHSIGYDIVHPSWIFACIDSQEIVLLEPQHCFLVSDKTMSKGAKRVDSFGDSYLTNLNTAEFGKIAENFEGPSKKKIKMEAEFHYQLCSSAEEHVDKEKIARVFSGISFYCLPLKNLIPAEMLTYPDLLKYNTNTERKIVFTNHMLQQELFIHPWEIQLFAGVVLENGGQIRENLEDADIIIAPNYLNERYMKNNNKKSIQSRNDFIKLLLQRYFSNLKNELERLRKINAEHPILRKADTFHQRFRRIVNEKFVFDCILENCLVPAERMYKRLICQK